MKTKISPLAIAFLAASASSGEIGAPEQTKDAGDITIGIGYYNDQSKWDIGNPAGNRIAGDLTRDGGLAKLAFGLHRNIEVIAKAGIEKIENSSSEAGMNFSTSGDNFFGLALKGIAYRNENLSIGPFIQYSEYSDYSITGSIANGPTLLPVSTAIKDLSTTEAGIGAQYNHGKTDFYGGIYAAKTDARASGEVNSSEFSNTIKEDSNIGGWIGVNHPINKVFVASGELHYTSDLGVFIGINYLIGHKEKEPEIVTKTEKVVEVQKVIETVYVERTAPVGPARFESEVNFNKNSSEIDGNHLPNIREFADFMKKYPKSRGIIEGHCDCDGSDNFNMQLSERRSKAVEAMMIKVFGIEPERLSIEYFGETKPIAENESETGKAINRRVRMVGIAE